MKPSRQRNHPATRPLMMAAACLASLLLATLAASAQTVTAEPKTVTDANKSQTVELKIMNASGSPDTATSDQVAKVTVGGRDAQFQKNAAGSITVTTPTGLNGEQTIQLLNSAGRSLGQVQLMYPAAVGGNGNVNTGRNGNTSGNGNVNGNGNANGNANANAPDDGVEARKTKVTEHWLFYLLVLAMFVAVVGPFAYTIYRAVRYSRSTYRSPLGLPVGSLRAILAYTLVSYLGFYILVSILTVSNFMPPDFLLGIVATVIGFYFGSRTDEVAGDPRTGSVRGLVRVGTEPARGAVVEFERVDDSTKPYSRITDIDGRFELRGARPGKYKVTARLTGSPPSPGKEITVSEGSDQEIELVIKSGDAAPKTGSMQGKVTKADNTPAPQATVTLSQGGAEKGKATADAAGSYKIENVAPGDYTAVATLQGSQPSDPAQVKVTAGAAQTQDLKLK